MTRAGGVPVALGRMLAYVTTAAPSAALLRHGRARWIEGIEVQGWRVREAGPRGVVLWRNHIRPSMPFRILVVPNRDCGLTHLEFQAVLA
ncbi:hypothetical protein, partial [Roseivivax isoporae]|uniref:hypothetical protein n=1 Tax=Roseivivax isoporae TaxID=591206 RepID=UPI0005C1FFAB